MGNPSTTRKGWFRLRNIVIVIALAIVGVAGWVALEVWRLHNAEPVISTNYSAQFREKSMQLAGITAKEGEGSWALMSETANQAAALIKRLQLEARAGHFEPRHTNDLGVDFDHVRRRGVRYEDVQPERHALQALREQGLFDSLERFERMPPGLRPTEQSEPMMITAMSALSESRDVAKALAASMRLEALAGNSDQVVSNFAAGLALAHTMSLQPGIICGLVAISIESSMCEELVSLLMEHEFTPGQCEAMLAAMQRHEPAPVAHMLAGERAAFHDFVQRNFSDDGRGDGYLLPQVIASVDVVSGGPQMATSASVIDCLAGRFYYADRRETLAVYDNFMDSLEAEAASEPGQRGEKGIDPHQFIAELPHRHMLVHLMGAAVVKASRNCTSARVHRGGTQLMIRIAIHRSKNQAWPRTLQELAPDLLPQIALDPLNGQAWGYRLLENDEHGRPYVLYSRGLDGADDGGVENENDRSAAITKRGSQGVDFILNPPREDLPPPAPTDD